MKNLYLIAAVGKNLELGYKNDLIWRIKEDLKSFKEKTMNSYIVMGKKTYDSMPKSLPGRKYIVLSKDAKEIDKDVIVFNDIDSLLDFGKSIDDKIFIIGGGQIYKLFIDYVNTMYLTEIDAEFNAADTYFPEFDKENWNIEKGSIQYDEVGQVNYRYCIYTKKDAIEFK